MAGGGRAKKGEAGGLGDKNTASGVVFQNSLPEFLARYQAQDRYSLSFNDRVPPICVCVQTYRAKIRNIRASVERAGVFAVVERSIARISPRKIKKYA